MLPSPIRTIDAPMPDMPVRRVDIPDVPVWLADLPTEPVYVIDLPRTPLIAAALPQMPRVLIDGELIPIITQHWVAALNGEGTLGAQLRARSTADAELGSTGGMVAVAIPRMFAVMALGGLGTLTASLKAKGPVVKTAQFKGVGSMGRKGGIGVSAGKAAFSGRGTTSMLDRALAYADARLSGGATLTAALALLVGWANASFKGGASLTASVLATSKVADTIFRGAGLLNSATSARGLQSPQGSAEGSFGAQVKAILAMSPQMSGLGSLTASAMMRALGKPTWEGAGTATGRVSAAIRGAAGSEGNLGVAWQHAYVQIADDFDAYSPGALPSNVWNVYSNKSPVVKASGIIGPPNPGTSDGQFIGVAWHRTPLLSTDHQAGVTIAKKSAQNFGAGALVRGSMATSSYVSGSVGGDGWQIWTCINGSLKQRGVGGGGSGYAVGDQVTMIATGATYQLYLNGTLLGSWTDSAGEYPYNASYTYAGVVSWSARAFFSNYYGPDTDNFFAVG
ncbi:hypothetical protein [Prescottella equi]|uniref:hypothetical protein n=1 Tax=Rhodococcus hoagii TaxID=43767 RepID=UPI000D0EC912|nr:hypothetical protein [Prescottella equi]AVP71342.1 hypothetical protein C7H75_24990 [Prescottella equi]